MEIKCASDKKSTAVNQNTVCLYEPIRVSLFQTIEVLISAHAFLIPQHFNFKFTALQRNGCKDNVLLSKKATLSVKKNK